MVEFMEAHDNIAKGYMATSDARTKSKELWDDLQNELNALGPPSKSTDQWKRVHILKLKSL